MDITTLGTVTAIVAICYLIGLAVKAIPNINGKRWRSTVANNVWEPGAYGWEEVTSDE